MNKRRNKVNMEKIFATVISLAIVAALVVGVVSILKNDKTKNQEKKNYIDLNQIDEALSTEDSENSTERQASVEKQTDSTTEPTTSRTADKKPDDDTNSDVAKETTAVDEKDVAKASEDETHSDNSGKNDEVSNTNVEPDKPEIVEPETQSQQADAETEPAGVSGEGGVELADAETDNSQDGDVPAGETVTDEATPVSASSATLLGYTFGDESSLMWPTQGNVILNYNMTNTIYFPTLDVYRCNPAIVISSEEGSVVAAAADGIVMSVYETKETGLTMQIAIGNEYVLTYGQLKDLVVGVGSQVKRGDVIGSVAAPSTYYSLEGDNLYFRLDCGDKSVNPMDYIEGE